MSEHTPGPWRVGDDENGDCWIFIPGHDLCFGDMETTDTCCWSNARLIAAAPELLEACELALKVFEQSGMITRQLLDADRKLRAAIAKARGEQ